MRQKRCTTKNKKKKEFKLFKRRVIISGVGMPVMGIIIFLCLVIKNQYFYEPFLLIVKKLSEIGPEVTGLPEDFTYMAYAFVAIFSFIMGIRTNGTNVYLIAIDLFFRLFIMPVTVFCLLWLFGGAYTALMGTTIWFLFLITGIVSKPIFEGFRMFINNC